MFRKLAMINKKNENVNTTYITVTGENGKEIEINGKTQMETEIINENRKKYHQTELSCLFMKDPLRNHF